MRVEMLKCPQCGAAVPQGGKRICFCCYCGSPLGIDDGVKRAESRCVIDKTTTIRDEARLREAENEAARLRIRERELDLEYRNQSERERRYAADHKEAANSIEVLPAPAERRKEKPVKSGGGGLAALFVIIALVYTFWPIDLMPGLLLDDLVCWFICMAAMKSAGRKQYEEM